MNLKKRNIENTMNNYRSIILDASALIAFLAEETGSDFVKQLLPSAVMSSINVAEVAQFLIINKKVDKLKAREIIEQLIAESYIFDNQEAFKVAGLIDITKKFGLSLADRACIALALKTGFPIYTADKVWKKLEIEHVDIHLIRS